MRQSRRTQSAGNGGHADDNDDDRDIAGRVTPYVDFDLEEPTYEDDGDIEQGHARRRSGSRSDGDTYDDSSYVPEYSQKNLFAASDDLGLTKHPASAPGDTGRGRSRSADFVMGHTEKGSGDDSADSKKANPQKRRSWRSSLLRKKHSSSSDGGNGGGLDPDFVEEIRRSILEYSRIINKRQGVGTGIYATPETTHEWGQEQKEHHVNWADLFMDLVFVATAFLEGKLIADTLSTRQWIGFFYFYVTFALLHECWSLKLHYSSRFNSADISHKLFDIVEVLIVALIAAHLSTKVAYVEDMDSGQLLGFVSCKLAHHLLHMLRWAELYWFSKKRIVRRQTMAFAKELIIGAIPLSAAVALAAFKFRAEYVMLCLFVATFIELGLEIFRVCFLAAGDNVKEHAVPMHIEYCTHRYGEWTMLMLGEGVMQIILVGFDKELSRYVTFVPAYLLLAAIRILFYSSQPFKAHGHALYQSVRRGFIWLQLQPIESSLIVCVGIGLRELMELSDTIGDPSEDRYSWFFCISTCALLTSVWCSTLLHSGLRREFLELPPRLRSLKVFTYTWKFFLSFSLLIMPLLHLEAYVLVSIALAVCVLQVISHDLWYRISKENTVDPAYAQSLHLIELDKRPDAESRIRSKSEDFDGEREKFSSPAVHHTSSLPDTIDHKKLPSSDTGSGSSTSTGSAQASSARKYDGGALSVLARQQERIEDSFKNTFRFGRFETSDDAVPRRIRLPSIHRNRNRHRRDVGLDGQSVDGLESPDAQGTDVVATDADLDLQLQSNPELQMELLRLMQRYPMHELQDGINALVRGNSAAKRQKRLRLRQRKIKEKLKHSR